MVGCVAKYQARHSAWRLYQLPKLIDFPIATGKLATHQLFVVLDWLDGVKIQSLDDTCSESCAECSWVVVIVVVGALISYSVVYQNFLCAPTISARFSLQTHLEMRRSIWFVVINID